MERSDKGGADLRQVPSIAAVLDQYLADGWDVVSVADGEAVLRKAQTRIHLVAATPALACSRPSTGMDAAVPA